MDVVISRYNEPLKPLPTVLPRWAQIRHYCKGNTMPDGCVCLPNVGVCDHTYLYHIVHYYDSLAPVTVFLPGSWYQGCKMFLTWYVLFCASIFKTTCLPAVPVFGLEHFQIDTWQSSNPNNRNRAIDLLPARHRPFGEWFRVNFPGEKLGPVVYKGIFAASAADIRRRPREFYANLLRQVDSHPRQEVSHFLERAWGSILTGPRSN